ELVAERVRRAGVEPDVVALDPVPGRAATEQSDAGPLVARDHVACARGRAADQIVLTADRDAGAVAERARTRGVRSNEVPLNDIARPVECHPGLRTSAAETVRGYHVARSRGHATHCVALGTGDG